MSVVTLVVFGLVLVPLLIAAAFLLNGKGAFLIAGYNTMGADKKRKYDEKALCRFVGWLIIAISVFMALIMIGAYLDIGWMLYSGLALSLLVIPAALIYANTGNRFRINDDREISVAEVSPTKTASKIITSIVSIISVVTLVVVGVLFIYGAREPVINVDDGGVHIKAMYGLTVDLSEITEINLLDSSMKDLGPGQRTNGYALGGTLKGHFKSDNLGEILLFVEAQSSPTLHIGRDGARDIYISFQDGEKTEALCQELLEIVFAR